MEKTYCVRIQHYHDDKYVACDYVNLTHEEYVRFVQIFVVGKEEKTK